MENKVAAEKNIQPGSRPEPKKPFKDAPFWGICLGHAFTHWYPASFHILLPYITLELGFSVMQAGLLVTIMYIAKSIASMPIGAVTDMTTRKNLLMAVSLTLAGLPFMFMGLANSFWLLMVLVIIMGIGNEMWHPSSFATLSTRFPEKRGFVFGFHGMSANLGDLLAPAIIGASITSMAWRDVIYWNVLPGILVGIYVLFLFRKMSVQGSGKNPYKKRSTAVGNMSLANYWLGIKELFRNRSVLLLAMASGIRSMAQNGLMTFLPLYLAIEMGLSPLWVGVYVSILQAGGLLAAPGVGAVSDKTGRRKIVFSGMVFTSIMVIVVTLVRIDWLLICTIALLGFFLYSLRPVMQAWAMESTAQKMAGTTTSLLFTSQSIMASSSPLIGGILADQYGLIFAFYFVAAVILAGNLIVAFIPKTEEELKTQHSQFKSGR